MPENVIDNFSGKYAFLSNFHPSPVKAYDVTYPTVEHAFQACKTRDLGWRETIRQASTPGQAKRLGRTAPLQDDWDNKRLHYMLRLVRRKFSDPKLGALLVATHPYTLVEGNNWNDTFWGVCNGKGENHLGQILMQVRGELIEKKGV